VVTTRVARSWVARREVECPQTRLNRKHTDGYVGDAVLSGKRTVRVQTPELSGLMENTGEV